MLAGDIGGTKTNLALFTEKEGRMEQLQETSYPSRKYDKFTELIREFLQENDRLRPARICLGVAGPVMNGKVQTTNLSWEVDSGEISRETGIGSVALINDLEATAYGLAGLADDDFFTIHEGNASRLPGNAAIIAPGTGLGEAGLYWDGKAYHPFATEGGHCEFSPRSEEDLELYRYLKEKYGIVSWERIISGPGIFNIYRFLLEIKKREEPSWLGRELEQGDPAAVISNTALEQGLPICKETMEWFVRYLACESTSLVLKLKATGGLFIGGGIPPRILAFLKEGTFYHTFLQSDRMEDLVSSVPVRVILNDKTALIGAAWYGAFSVEG